jgi:hypothetical protein
VSFHRSPAYIQAVFEGTKAWYMHPDHDKAKRTNAMAFAHFLERLKFELFPADM